LKIQKTIAERTKRFFTTQPKLLSAFQLASNCLTGVHLSAKERKVKHHFIVPLEKGIIEPSFYQNNIKKGETLKVLLMDGMKKLHMADRRVGFVLPEISQKTFLLSFDSLPATLKERDQLVHFRVKKQLPLLPDDARMAYSLMPHDNQVRVLASVARASVIKEYEDFFSQLKLKIRSVGMPFAGLVNLIIREGENVMLVNIEEDVFSLVGITNSEISLYRQKSFALEAQDEDSVLQKFDDIALEIENTISFIQEKEKREIVSLWIRTGLPESEEEIMSVLAEKLSIPVRGVDACLPGNLAPKKKRLLSALVGYML
jgi:hypothetical protein